MGPTIKVKKRVSEGVREVDDVEIFLYCNIILGTLDQ